jgi:predicted nucleic acid-binding protein
MIVQDTNVISELMRAEPHPAVLAWVALPKICTSTPSTISASSMRAVTTFSRGAAAADHADQCRDEFIRGRPKRGSGRPLPTPVGRL